MAYKVWHPNSGMVYGVFSDLQEAQECYQNNYTTATDLQPQITEI